jgi:hypothetical protein
MKEAFSPNNLVGVNDTKLKRNEYYHMLRKLKNDFLKTTIGNRSSHTEFSDYVEDTVGLRMQFQGSMISEHYTIVDKEKFFLYKLKQ